MSSVTQTAGFSCYGGMPSPSRIRRQSSYNTIQSSGRSPVNVHATSAPVRKADAFESLHGVLENEDTTAVLPVITKRMDETYSKHDKRQALPLKARSSVASFRSTKRNDPRCSVSALQHVDLNSPNSSVTLDVGPTRRRSRQNRPTVNTAAINSSTDSLSISPTQNARTSKRRSGLRNMFSFEPFRQMSRHSIKTPEGSLASARSSQEESNPSTGGRDSPNTTVNRWMMATFDKQSGRTSSMSSTSQSSSAMIRAPSNARKPTNSVDSRQSTVGGLGNNSRASSGTQLSAKAVQAGQQLAKTIGAADRARTSATMLDEREKFTVSSTAFLERPSSPRPSERKASWASTQDDVIICDAAATSFFSVGRPKSIYGVQSKDFSAAPRASAQNITREAVASTRFRPQVLQFLGGIDSQNVDLPLQSPSSTSSTSSDHWLFDSASPSSTTPSSSPGTPRTPYPETSTSVDQDSLQQCWLEVNTSASAVPANQSNALATPATSSLSPFSTTRLKNPAILSDLTTSRATVSSLPTTIRRRTNPYTDASALFPTPCVSPISALTHSARQKPEETYFKLPASSSAHPNLYPDLLRAKGMVVETLTAEEAQLIRSMRSKRAAMRREELERLGRTLGVGGDEGGLGRGSGP